MVICYRSNRIQCTWNVLNFLTVFSVFAIDSFQVLHIFGHHLKKNDHVIPVSICEILSALAGIFENNASEYNGNLYLFLALLQTPLLFPRLGADFWVKPCMFYHVRKVSINSSFVGVKFFKCFPVSMKIIIGCLS